MTSDLRNGQRECLEEFIEMYRNKKCLWQVKTKDCHNKIKKDDSYERLVWKMREIDPLANRDSVVKKNKQFAKQFPKGIEKKKALSRYLDPF
jgi:hypothetical protein